ncbi:MAG: TM2 domain-containing protein [Actinobacteria bacterium]|nr:TM2 domain-containing protein [Actinomycetota bacterium]
MSIKGERKVWLAYLLWPTFIGHRWYLGKISLLYVITLGYAGIMWLADLFRIPSMVRERNTYAYQRHLAYAAEGSGGVLQE